MTDITTREKATIRQITPDELIGYISAVSTGTKKATFYNMKEEQVAALMDNISNMIGTFRPFAALMALSPAMTDDAKTATAVQLFSTAPMAENSDHEKAIRRWESSILTDAICNMPPTRAFDLFHYLNGYRRQKNGKKSNFVKQQKAAGGRYVKGMAKRWLLDNFHKLDLWSVKYAEDLRKLAKHLHLGESDFHGVKFLFGEDAKAPLQRKLVKVREASPDSVPQELWELPYENARGFALGKFKLSKEEFEKRYSERGKKTVKEARTSAKRTKEAGGEVTFDPKNARSLFELFVYLGGQDSIPHQAKSWIDVVAEKQAKRIGIKVKDTAVIIDTSLSMFGTKATKRHPLYKALAIARTLEKACVGQFKILYTTEQTGDLVLPKLHGATSYAQQLINAIKEGFTNIFLIGDGYENSPEGMTHRVLHAFKKKIDTENKVSVVHLNPVQAAESSSGVREMSPYAPSAGIRDVESISSAVFVALAKTYPVKALEAYFNELAGLQTAKTKALMPPQYQKMLTG